MFLVGPEIYPPTQDELFTGEVTFPLTRWFELRDHILHPFERHVLEAMVPLVRGFHKYVEVKIRCYDLRKGDYTCKVPGWHFDTVTDSHDPRTPETHHLYCTAPTTQFLINRESIDNPWVNGPEIPAPKDRIVTYGRMMHSAPRMPFDGKRLMIRISETDVVKPRMQVQGR